MSEYEKLQKFLWARYGNEGLDLCAGTVKLWIGRILGLSLSDGEALQAAIDKMKRDGQVLVHGSRTEVINPYEGTVDWKKYVEQTINDYEKSFKIMGTISG
jgi:hypothetical protein